jgi:hypothetical protein
MIKPDSSSSQCSSTHSESEERTDSGSTTDSPLQLLLGPGVANTS